MEELNDGCQFQVIFALVPTRVRREQYKQWPKSLTSGFYQVVADFFNQRYPGAQSIDDQSVYSAKIIVDYVVERVFNQSAGRIGAQVRPLAYDLQA